MIRNVRSPIQYDLAARSRSSTLRTRERASADQLNDGLRTAPCRNSASANQVANCRPVCPNRAEECQFRNLAELLVRNCFGFTRSSDAIHTCATFSKFNMIRRSLSPRYSNLRVAAVVADVSVFARSPRSISVVPKSSQSTQFEPESRWSERTISHTYSAPNEVCCSAPNIRVETDHRRKARMPAYPIHINDTPRNMEVHSRSAETISIAIRIGFGQRRDFPDANTKPRRETASNLPSSQAILHRDHIMSSLVTVQPPSIRIRAYRIREDKVSRSGRSTTQTQHPLA